MQSRKIWRGKIKSGKRKSKRKEMIKEERKTTGGKRKENIKGGKRTNIFLRLLKEEKENAKEKRDYKLLNKTKRRIREN